MMAKRWAGPEIFATSDSWNALEGDFHHSKKYFTGMLCENKPIHFLCFCKTGRAKTSSGNTTTPHTTGKRKTKSNRLANVQAVVTDVSCSCHVLR